MRLILILLMFLPMLIFLLLPGGGTMHGGIFLWLMLMLGFWLMSMRFGTRPQKAPAAVGHPLSAAEQPETVKAVMDVRYAEEQAGVRIFRGSLRAPAASVYTTLKRALGTGSTPMVQADEEFGAIIVLPPEQSGGQPVEKHASPWINALLFILTLGTTTYAGAAHQGINLLHEPGRFAVGLPYALGLLTILGVHELGHYFTARHHRIHVTLPFFIPLPFALGTFGAFIKMRSLPEDRRSLFDVAVAGPLAGLVIALPALFFGLRSSVAMAAHVGSTPGILQAGTSISSSVLLALVAKLSLGPAMVEGTVLRLGPLAFAGWLGLMVTALNLLPIGQLDGGHIAHAMFGRHAGNVIGSAALWTLVLLGLFVWPGLLTWAVIVYFIAGRSVPPLDDLTPLDPARRWLGYAAFVILALILAPVPHLIWDATGIHCPYL